MCYQDFKDTFVCNTQLNVTITSSARVVLSGFQRYFCMQYTTSILNSTLPPLLCYQDFKDTFVCNTQRIGLYIVLLFCCAIRISKILLYAIHNERMCRVGDSWVVLSGFQRYFCMQYTTWAGELVDTSTLCYQDFKERFDCKSTEKIRNMQIYTKFICIITKKVIPLHQQF